MEAKAREDQVLLDVEGLAEMLRVPKRRIAWLRRVGKLPPGLRIGGKPVWLRSAVLDWLRAGAPAGKQQKQQQQQKQREEADCAAAAE